jgi:2-phospho-L-lactate guanylyltransferase
MTTLEPDAASWIVVVPAKRLGAAKSRLGRLAGGRLAGARRSELALAMLVDTITAARAAIGVRAVLVVTDDADVTAAALAHGAEVLPDRPAAGLNAAFAFGIDAVRAQDPDIGAVLLAGDLPALRPAQLEAVLDVATGLVGMVTVADRAGTGTTLLAARTPATLRPAFGPDSFARHRALGATAADLPGLDGLRCDVDDIDDLREAVRLGIGPATAAALQDLGLELAARSDG